MGTRCYYEDKMAKHLDSDCLEPAVINGQITTDYSLQTILFESDFPQCIELVGERVVVPGPGPGSNRAYGPKRPKKPKKPNRPNNYSPNKPKKPSNNNNNNSNYKPKTNKKPDNYKYSKPNKK